MKFKVLKFSVGVGGQILIKDNFQIGAGSQVKGDLQEIFKWEDNRREKYLKKTQHNIIYL